MTNDGMIVWSLEYSQLLVWQLAVKTSKQQEHPSNFNLYLHQPPATQALLFHIDNIDHIDHISNQQHRVAT